MIFMVPGWFLMVFHGFRWFICLFFYGSWLAFNGSRSVFKVFHSYRLVFNGSRSVFIVFHSSRLVLHGFSWLRVGFHGSR